MGYTHYWERDRELDPVRFHAAVTDCRKFCKALPIPIGDRDGHGKPIFTADRIEFNGHVDSTNFSTDGAGLNWPTADAQGVSLAGDAAAQDKWNDLVSGSMLSSRAVDEAGDGSYEGFIVDRVADPDDQECGPGRCFKCCKTNFRPYDLLVQGCLIILKEHLGAAIRVSSDGTNKQWNEARDGVQIFCGFGLMFDLDD